MGVLAYIMAHHSYRPARQMMAGVLCLQNDTTFRTRSKTKESWVQTKGRYVYILIAEAM